MDVLGVLSLWPPFGGGDVVAYPDLVAASRAALSDDVDVADAFGDTPSTPKFFGDYAVGSPALPYLVFGEPDATREYFGLGNYIERGQIVANVFAPGKLRARVLANLAAGVLNDADLVLDGAVLMLYRARVLNYNPVPDVAPGFPQAYQRTISIEYMTRGSIA
jgi:hypothetical protein